MQMVLAVDEGTTNSKAVLIDQNGAVMATASAPVAIQYPQAAWVEQDAEQIWTSTVAAISACLAQRPEAEILALGISNQRESVLVWDRATGQALGPVITWQCRRTADECAALKLAGHEKEILRRTGLMLDPLFPATKVKWLLDHHCQGRDLGSVCVGTVDSWLIHRFSGGMVHATDASNAARTQLFNIKDMAWDADLCALFGVDPVMLPQVQDSAYVFGITQGVRGLPNGIPIAAAIGDSHAALFGHGAFGRGDGKITFGTGSSVMTTLDGFAPPPKGITTTIAWAIGGVPTYAFEGNILVSASILPWTAQMLGLADVETLLTLARSVADAGGVSLVPAHVGLGAPRWNSSARGLISGLSFTTTPAHIARAAVESMALQVQAVFAVIAAHSSHDFGRLFVDGGPSRNGFIMGLVADYLDHAVITSENTEASALGAAYLAGLAVGFWPDLAAIASLKGARDIIAPNMPAELRQSTLNQWHQAIAQSVLPT
jgi:glycerol kinase